MNEIIKKGLSRRELLKTAVVVTPVAMTGCATVSRTGEPLLRADDPVARAVGYYANTNEVPADHPLAANHTTEQNCANCIHGRGSAGIGTIDCPIFPGRSVNTNGWCSIWAKAR